MRSVGAFGVATGLLAVLTACGSADSGATAEASLTQQAPSPSTAQPASGASATELASEVSSAEEDWAASLISGPTNPEDLVTLSSGKVVVSGMGGDPGGEGGAAGSLYGLDVETQQLTELWPADELDVAPDEERFAECPGPPDGDVASPHGLGVETEGDGTEYLYVVNHGGREAIEVFTVGGSAETPQLTWVGCSVLPEGSMGNGVAPDPLTDGFYVTHFLDPADMLDEFERAFGGEATGHVLRWTPEDEWAVVEGTEMSTPNGIAVSPEGTSLYVASWGGRELVEVDAQTGERQASTAIDLMPDNLRSTENGKLLVTGQVIDEFETFVQYESGEREPEDRYDVYELDPVEFSVERIAHGTPEGFGNPTTALEVQGGMLVGSVTGTKILQLERE